MSQAHQASAERDEAKVGLGSALQQVNRWRVLYEASVEHAAGAAADGEKTIEAAMIASEGNVENTTSEVRALLRAGIAGQAREQIAILEDELSAARAAAKDNDQGTASGKRKASGGESAGGKESSAAGLAEARAKVAEASAEKFRKAAAHWKAQHTKVKEQLDSAVAAAAATEGGESTGGGESAEELDAAKARIAALEADVADASATRDGLAERLAAAEAASASLQGEVEAKATAALEVASKVESFEAAVAAAEAKAAAAEAKAASAEAKAAAAESALSEGGAGLAGVSDGIADASALSALQEKLAATESSAEKLRKAAAHWKAQHTKVKEQLDSAVAAAAATEGGESTGGGESAEELDAAKARIAALEAHLAQASSATASVQEQLDKFRTAARHWKRQYDSLLEEQAK